jgi:hypothetical protein
MSNIEITTNTTNGIRVWNPVHKDDLVRFAGAATLLAGTILARDSVSLLLVPFVKGGTTNANGVPVAVLGYQLAASGAATLAARPIVGGEIRASQLIIAADADDSEVDAAVLDQLRDYSIIALSTVQLSAFDNQ